MTGFLLGLAIGTTLGFLVGIVILSVCMGASRADDAMDRERLEVDDIRKFSEWYAGNYHEPRPKLGTDQFRRWT